MRPDKHKKRQHAAYAKKAEKKGNRNNRATSDTNGERATTKVRSSPDQWQKHQHNFSRPGSKLNDSNQCNNSELKDVLDQRDLASQKKSPDNVNFSLPSFSRRKIESNWEQYEEYSETDELVERRGADFTLLLNQTVGSDFRFKDEDTLDDSTQVDIASMLSFNCVELAQKLQSIALPERLEIPRTVFDVESLEILDQDAVTSATIGHSEDSRRVQNADKSVTSNETATDYYLDQELDDILSTTEKRRTSEMPNEIESNSSQGELLEETSNFSTSVDHKVKTQVLNSVLQAKHLDCSEEDELDFLLSLDAPAIEAKVNHKDDPLVKSRDTNPNPTTDSYQQSESSVPVDSAGPSISSSETVTENLEDWLDSILED